MREISTHKVNGCNEAILIETPDDLTLGGAPTTYLFAFQNGPIAEVGTNGLTHEALAAVIIDRLEGFQRGPYACADNAEALEHYRAAMNALRRRTLARVARGVEGTHQK
jgi:hypothetical protein